MAIYADYNATSPLSSLAKLWMGRGLEVWGNPSSSHALGRQALELIEKSRSAVASAAGVSASEVVFTSGGSESNASVLLGSYLQNPARFRLLISSVEHSSVRDAADFLRSSGAEVHELPVLPTGELDWPAFEKAIERSPSLVSIMAANNETGTIYPIGRIVELCRAKNIPVHVDAVQAFGKLSPELWNQADFISISAHKIGGPKGIGALIVKKGRQLQAIHFGGAQEIKRRGGTENVTGILGFGGAAAERDLSGWDRIAGYRLEFENRLQELEGVRVHSTEISRLPNTTSVRIEGIQAEVLLGALDLDGIYISAGSACSSGSMNPSHVLMAMGLTKDEARECLRISWGLESKPEEFEKLAQRLIHHVQRIRSRRRAG